MILNKAQIFAVNDSQYKLVDVPEWKSEANPKPQVKLKTLSFQEQLEYEELKKLDNDGAVIVGLVYRSCVDENNNKLFDSEDDLKELQKRSANVICKLFKEALELNAIKEGELEKGAKNS